VAHGLDEVLVVELAGQRYGLPGAIVRELLRAVLITPIARGSNFVEGVVSIRGKILPVLNLRQWLALPAKALEPSDHFVVVWTGRGEAILRVDRALELARIPVSSVDRGEPGSGALARVAQFGGQLVLLPDLDSLFAEEPSALQALAAAEGLRS
jgi:purine-binding chemotaxis protein CheW